jgi:S1-C subfamily serine protease
MGHISIDARNNQQSTAVSPVANSTTVGSTSVAPGTSSTPIRTTLYPACPATGASGAVATVSLATSVPVTLTTSHVSTNTTENSGSMTTDTAPIAGSATAPNSNGNGSASLPTAPVGTPTSQPSSGYLAIRTETVENCGVRVIEVLLNTSADSNQLKAGDVIVAIDGRPLSALMAASSGAGTITTGTPSTSALGNMALTQPFYIDIQSRRPGTNVLLTVHRAGQQIDISVSLSAIPSSTVAPGPSSTAIATPTS